MDEINGIQTKQPFLQQTNQRHQSQQELWLEARRSFSYGCAALLVAAFVFGVYIYRLPPLKDHELDELIHNFPPSSVASLIILRDTSMAYAEKYPATIALGIMMLYVIMQTFAIPGTISLTLLAGALYGSTRGFLLVAVVSTLGSSSCYGMSCLFGRPIAKAVWKQKLEDFKQEVAKQKTNMLSYIIFLRVTPILPNVFINVASPIVGVPFLEFMFGTLIGCAPNNFMAAHAGDHLSELDSLADLYKPRMLLLGLTMGCVALLPVYVKHKHASKQAAALQKNR